MFPSPLQAALDVGARIVPSPSWLHLIGVRTTNGTPDAVDDWLYACAIGGASNRWLIRVFPLETEPSSAYLGSPLNPKGTAIMVPGHYRDAYNVGKHKGRRALAQVKPVKVYRDNNRNATIELDPKSADTGMFGINIHDIRGDLAGCQGIRTGDMDELMYLADSHVRLYGAGIDYTLLGP
jgi:hypothetical protein